MTAQRCAGIGGLTFIVLLIAGIALAPIPPVSTATAADVLAYFDANADAVLRQTFVLGFCGAVALIAFVGGLCAVLGRAEGTRAGLSTVALVGGTAIVPGLVIVAATHAGLARLGARISAETAWAIWRVSTLADLMTTFIMGSFALAASLSASETKLLPRWIIGLGVVSAVAYFVMGFDVVLKDSVIRQESPFGIAALLLFLVWVGATSVVLLSRSRQH